MNTVHVTDWLQKLVSLPVKVLKFKSEIILFRTSEYK